MSMHDLHSSKLSPWSSTPVVVKGTLDVPIGNFAPFATFEYGLHDYPFSHLRVGLKYRFQLIK